MGENDQRPFSIANVCSESGQVELHIGVTPGNHYASQTLDYLLENADDAVVDFPHGEAFLQSDSHQPIILLAGGTGYSYAASLLAGVLQQQRHAKTILYWGTRNAHEMYDSEHLLKLAEKTRFLSSCPLLMTNLLMVVKVGFTMRSWLILTSLLITMSMWRVGLRWLRLFAMTFAPRVYPQSSCSATPTLSFNPSLRASAVWR